MSEPSSSGQPVAAPKWSSKEVSEYLARWGVEDAVQQARIARSRTGGVRRHARGGMERLLVCWYLFSA